MDAGAVSLELDIPHGMLDPGGHATGVIVAGAGGTAIYFGTRDRSAPMQPGDGTLHITGSIH